MNLIGVGIFTLRAATFASATCAAFVLILRMRGKRVVLLRLIQVFYLAALVQITVIRENPDWGEVFCAPRGAVQWLPLKTTIHQWNLGAWRFIYHVVGNLIWFVPLGAMFRNRRAWVPVLVGMLLSVSIECLQWVFLTGIADVDDVLLNTCGALIGYLLARAWHKLGNRLRFR